MKKKITLKQIVEDNLLEEKHFFDCLVTNVSYQIASNNKAFLNMTLKTRDLQIKAKKWDSSPEELKIFSNSHYFTIYGKLNFHNQEAQIIIYNWAILSPEMIDYEKLLPIPPYSLSKMKEEFLLFLSKIEDPHYSAILKDIFNPEILELFCQTRAGLKIHHTVYGGLLWHTLTMLKIAKKLVAIYAYLPINIDLLYAGIILHDLGKIEEIGDFFASSYSLTGNLIGHIGLGSLWVEKVANKLAIPKQKKELLQHLILASHGDIELGSLVKPVLIEAELLAKIDLLDAQMGKIFNIVGFAPEIGSFTNKVFLNGKTHYYWLHHKITKKS